MSYQDLKAWQQARVLASLVYRTTAKFPRSEMFGLARQLRRAAVSVVCNIAEGQGRWSFKDQIHFYYIARGSLLETETQLMIAGDVGYIDQISLQAALDISAQVGRGLNGLINSTVKRAKTENREPRPDN